MENICFIINKYPILVSRLHSDTLEHKIVSNTGPLGSYMYVPSSECRICTIEGLHNEEKTIFNSVECKLSQWVKIFAVNPDELSFIPRAHIVERENRLLKVL